MSLADGMNIGHGDMLISLIRMRRSSLHWMIISECTFSHHMAYMMCINAVILPYARSFFTPHLRIQDTNLNLNGLSVYKPFFPLGFNDNIYHEGNISEMPDFDVFSLSEIKKRKKRFMVSTKMGVLNENIKLS